MRVPQSLPTVDVESYVPAAITAVRRSSGWPGIFVHERLGKAGEVNYPAGLRQHVFYWFLKPLHSEIRLNGRVEHRQYEAGEGRFTPAAVPVAFRWSTDVHLIMLGFQPWFFERLASEARHSATISSKLILSTLGKDHPACRLMPFIEQELDAHPGASMAAEGIARAIAIHLLREFEPARPTRSAEPAPPFAVLRAVELMREHLRDPLSLEEIANAAGVSPFHFARQFKAATGYPPHDYLVRLRVDRAQELILQNGREWTLAAIASESGFADQSHMARHFKRVLGVTPGAFADANKPG